MYSVRTFYLQLRGEVDDAVLQHVNDHLSEPERLPVAQRENRLMQSEIDRRGRDLQGSRDAVFNIHRVDGRDHHVISRNAFFLESFEVDQGGFIAGVYRVIFANETREGGPEPLYSPCMPSSEHPSPPPRGG